MKQDIAKARRTITEITLYLIAIGAATTLIIGLVIFLNLPSFKQTDILEKALTEIFGSLLN